MARKKPLAVPPKGTAHQPKQVTRGFSFRFYPNLAQQEYLTHSFGCTRFVYNKLLEQTKTAYSDFKANKTTDKPDLSDARLCSKLLTQLKHHPEHPWLQQVSSTVSTRVLLQPSHRLQEQASLVITNFLPSSPSTVSSLSPSRSLGSLLEGKYLKLAKLDTLIKLKLSRQLPSAPTRVTVTKTPSGKYFVTFTVKVPKARKSGKGTIGIDLGIKDYAVFSDGTKITNPRHFLKLQQKLAHEQRMLSKKQKGSSNRNKQRIKVARLHERITNIRNDFLHKLTAAIVSENQAIVVEALKVVNMLRNHKLAKHIADASWSKFKQMLVSKIQETSSGCLIIADTYFPSTQTCSTCGDKPQVKLTLSAREWECPTCHSHHDRDVNAAMNLELLGKKVLLLAKQGLIPEGKQFYLSSDYGTLVHSS
jgi:putative transposase